MKITAYDLKELQVIDQIIPEPKGGAHRDVDEQAAHIDHVLNQSLEQLTGYAEEELLENRWKKYKQIGNYKTLS
jgi:acetyl-CoA carboxylase carboxyl transferase subunit alpha